MFPPPVVGSWRLLKEPKISAKLLQKPTASYDKMEMKAYQVYPLDGDDHDCYISDSAYDLSRIST